MLIFFHQAPRLRAPIGVVPPLVALTGVLCCGLPWLLRGLLAALCLWTLAQRWPSRPPGCAPRTATVLAVSASAVAAWCDGHAAALLPLAASGRAAGWGLGLQRARWDLGAAARSATAAGVPGVLPAVALHPAGLRRLARFLLHRHPARAARHRRSRRIGYNRALRPPPTATCPPS